MCVCVCVCVFVRARVCVCFCLIWSISKAAGSEGYLHSHSTSYFCQNSSESYVRKATDWPCFGQPANSNAPCASEIHSNLLDCKDPLVARLTSHCSALPQRDTLLNAVMTPIDRVEAE